MDSITMTMLGAGITLAIGLAAVVVSWRRLKAIDADFKASQTAFERVEAERHELDLARKAFERLQSDYEDSRAMLQKKEAQVALYNIGVGTVDTQVYIREQDPDRLPALEEELEDVLEKIKVMVKNKRACVCGLNDDFVVNGKRSEAKKLINREIKLRLRCFDNEVKAAKELADWHNIHRLIERVKQAQREINEKSKIMEIVLKVAYLNLRVREIQLHYEIRQLKHDIKETEREEARVQREADREEARLQAATEKAKKARERMERLVEAELAKLDGATEEQRALLESHKEELEALKQREARAVSMAQQTRAGFVYVISNPLAFGQGMVKIGMTRRLDPYERVRELGDASVPDTFDVHALFYCDDAPALESHLHQLFEKKRINLVNRRKEFFRVAPEEVIEAAEAAQFPVERAA
ncbi:MAG: hypothetical protein C9356_15860 [Oleiphilus sp.]|nr:MAG: hypothetical protein C9356_15860 [Oleiphilus sp.]